MFCVVRGRKYCREIRRSEYYYPLFNSILTNEDTVIHVPLKSKDKYDAFKVILFPFSGDNSMLTLDMPPFIVLIGKDYTV